MGFSAMQRGSFFLTMGLLALVCRSACAATIHIQKTSQGVVASLDGEIAKGDSAKLASIIQGANARGDRVTAIKLNSPGGVVLEGVEIAEVVRRARVATYVAEDSQCASACFIILAAGSEKFVDYSALIGVHGVADRSGNETVEASAATVALARIANELNVPPSIIGMMVVTPPDDIVWLTPQELRSMSVTMIGKPIPASTGHVAGSADSSSPAPTWGKLLDRAMTLSKNQNNGSALFTRACEPEREECINGLSFNAPDGTYMIMKTTENLRGKMMSREICSFTNSRTERVCIDWDTGERHHDLKDKKGDWNSTGD